MGITQNLNFFVHLFNKMAYIFCIFSIFSQCNHITFTSCNSTLFSIFFKHARYWYHHTTSKEYIISHVPTKIKCRVKNASNYWICMFLISLPLFLLISRYHLKIVLEEHWEFWFITSMWIESIESWVKLCLIYRKWTCTKENW